MRALIVTLIMVLVPLIAGRADETIPAATLEKIKEATVFIKASDGTGSGFVIKVDGDAAFIATNDHVVHRRNVKGEASAQKLTAVFHSGTKKQQSVDAVILATDPERDLALIKVAGVKDMPTPLDLSRAAELKETLLVYGFGFPFGKKLATGTENPSITVTRGSISSIRRNDDGELVKVQIDGALNPGNSGGPVVDAEGRLVGVVNSGIQGSGIAFAVPPQEVTKMLAGRLGKAILALKKKSKDSAEVEIRLYLIDPLAKIKSVSFYYAPAQGAAKKDRLDAIPAAKKIELTVAKQKALGTLSLSLTSKLKDRIYWQTVHVHKDGSTHFSKASLYDPHNLKSSVAAQERPEGEPELSKVRTALGMVAPGSIDQAIDWLRSGQPLNLIACHSLAKVEVYAPRQEEVARELEKLFVGNDKLVAGVSTQALVTWATKEQVPALAKALADAGNSNNKNILDALRRLNDPRAAPALAKRLTTSFDRKAAAQVLISLGPPVAKDVRKYLDHADKKTRDEAARILREIGKDAPGDAFKAALANLREPAGQAKTKALEWFATAKVDESRRGEIIPELIKLVKDRSPFIRDAAARALETWATAAEVPLLISEIQERGPNANLIHALGRLKDKRAIPILAEMLGSPFNSKEAVAALTAIGPKVEKDVAKYLNRERHQTKLAAFKVLQQVGTAASVPALQAIRAEARKEMYKGYEEIADAASSAIEAIQARRELDPQSPKGGQKEQEIKGQKRSLYSSIRDGRSKECVRGGPLDRKLRPLLQDDCDDVCRPAADALKKIDEKMPSRRHN